MKRLCLLLGVLFLMSSITVFAGGGSQPSTGPVTLEFYSWLDEEPYLTKVIDRWNATNQNSRIIGNFFPSGDDYNQRLTVSLSGGAPIDIFCQSTPAGMAEFIALGEVVDLTDMMRRNNFDESGISDFLASFREELGAAYGLPYRKSVWAIFYNRMLFDEAGVPYPNNLTWDEYRDVGLRLTRGTGQDRIYGILNYAPTSGWWRLSANVRGANNPMVPEHLEEFKRNAQKVWEWSYVYNVQPPYADRTGTAGGDYAGAFLSGRFAMMINGDWAINMLNNGIAAGSNLVYDVAVMPHQQGDAPYSTGVPTIGSITRLSRHPEQAFEFLSFLAGPQAAQMIAREGMIPAWSSPEIITIFREQLPMPRNIDVFFTQNVRNQAPFNAQYNQAMTIMNQEMSLFFLLEQDLDRTFDTIARRIRDEIY